MKATSLLPLFAVEQGELADANKLLAALANPLGACRRPFGSLSHVLLQRGEPISCTVAASTVSSTCDGDTRKSLVELARIGRSDEAPWVMRVMLRLWRVDLAHEWPYWPVT